jgi:alpha-glucosidase
VYARRKGDVWYVGGISGEARTVKVPLTFLAKGTPQPAVIYRDADDRSKIVEEARTVTSKDVLTFSLQKAGGFVVRVGPGMPETFRQ